MKKILILIISYFFVISSSYAEVIKDILVKNNDRISKETIITYGNIELGKNYDQAEINKVLKNLYKTDFFENISLYIENSQLIIDVKENKIIQTVIVQGVKSSEIQKSILKNLYSKDKAPF